MHALFCDRAQVSQLSRLIELVSFAFRTAERRRHLRTSIFSRLNRTACTPPRQRFGLALRFHRMTRGQDGYATSFPV